MPENRQQYDLILQELVRRANTHTQRLRTIDEHIRNINSKIENFEHQKIRMENSIKKNIENILKEIEKINKNISDLNNEILKLKEKDKQFPKKSEVEELAKLIELLSPIKHEFITWNEFNREIDKLKKDIFKYGSTVST
ncbi:MAG: hypothetical protein B6U88_02590 [Candidatus Aenigmarchaeota archaeon ex4484_56]|nr:MAG: hypothetical protein B6U88_02590 [Candidatus Aenigmarchaeota archaeon ex4484_56]